MDGIPGFQQSAAQAGDAGTSESNRKNEEEMRKSMLVSIMTPEARERLSRISIVKPDKGRKIEDRLLMAARSGRLGGVVDEQRLIQMLEQISEAEDKSKPKIKIQRRSYFDDDDEDDNDDDLL